MNRKDTILVAVLINAGVLVVLFTSALKNKQPHNMSQNVETALVSEQKLEPTSILKDELDLAIEQAKKEQLQTEAVSAPLQDIAAPAQAPLVTSAPTLVDVVVKKGDFLAKIAKRHGVTVAEIMKTNGLKNANLRIGQVLKIPQNNPILAPQEVSLPQPQEVNAPQIVYYTIKSGDNPWTIAQKHKMKVEDLLKLNNLTAEKAKQLKIGDRLKVKG